MEQYLMYLKTVQSTAFKILIEALKEILTDCNLEFTNESMRIQALDPSHTVLVHLKLDAINFEKYYCPNKIILGINTLNLFKLIKTMNNNDTLTFYIEKDNSSQLGIKIENGERNQVTNFYLNLMDLNHDNVNIPSMSFNSVITLPSNDFQKLCRDSYNLADNIEIKSIQDTLTFSLKGDWCEQETTIGKTDNNFGLCVVKQTNDDDIIQGVFSLKHLVLFTKCTNLSNSIELYLKNDYPLIIKYAVANLGEIKLCLAPINPE